MDPILYSVEGNRPLVRLHARNPVPDHFPRRGDRTARVVGFMAATVVVSKRMTVAQWRDFYRNLDPTATVHENISHGISKASAHMGTRPQKGPAGGWRASGCVGRQYAVVTTRKDARANLGPANAKYALVRPSGYVDIGRRLSPLPHA